MQKTNGRTVENPHSGQTIRFTKTAAETGGDYVEFEVTLAPGAVPIPPHCHPVQVERGYVLEGTLGVTADSQTTVLKPQEEIHIPAGIVHSLYNAGQTRLRAVSRIEPALHFDEVLWTITATAAAQGRAYPSLLHMAVILRRYPGEMYAGGLPTGVQKALLGPLAWLGRMLGYEHSTGMPQAGEHQPQ